MKVTVEEYRRGLLSWNPESRAVWYTSTTASPDDPREWSGPLAEPQGSKVESPHNSFRQLRFALIDPSVPEKPYPVRWERLNENGIVQTELWDRPSEHAFAKEHGPIPEVEARKKRYAPALKKLLKDKVDESTYGLLQQTLGRATTRDRFAFYAAQRGLAQESVARFDALARLRNDAFHGDAVEVDDQRPVDAKNLLVQMLKRELGIAAKVPWETLPQVGVLYFRYKLQDLGDRGATRPPPDSGASETISAPFGRLGTA